VPSFTRNSRVMPIDCPPVATIPPHRAISAHHVIHHHRRRAVTTGLVLKKPTPLKAIKIAVHHRRRGRLCPPGVGLVTLPDLGDNDVVGFYLPAAAYEAPLAGQEAAARPAGTAGPVPADSIPQQGGAHVIIPPTGITPPPNHTIFPTGGQSPPPVVAPPIVTPPPGPTPPVTAVPEPAAWRSCCWAWARWEQRCAAARPELSDEGLPQRPSRPPRPPGLRATRSRRRSR